MPGAKNGGAALKDGLNRPGIDARIASSFLVEMVREMNISINKHHEKTGVWGVRRNGRIAAVIMEIGGLFVFQSIIPPEKYSFTDKRRAMDFARGFFDPRRREKEWSQSRRRE